MSIFVVHTLNFLCDILQDKYDLLLNVSKEAQGPYEKLDFVIFII